MFFTLLFSSIYATNLVELINNDPKALWKAVEYPREMITRAKMFAMSGDKTTYKAPKKYFAPDPSTVPVSFDARKKWPNKLSPIADQGTVCGGCWAFASAEAVGDRFNIKGCPKGVLSPQDLISCDKYDNGCDGGAGDTSMRWIADHGVATEQCLPYVSIKGRVPACPARCMNGSSITRYKIDKMQVFHMDDVQKELMENGPLAFNYRLYEDMMHYKSGIYHHLHGKDMGGRHAVLLIGWGVENDVPYWLIQNSWGADWGEAGHFRMLRGVNECGCEEGFYAGNVTC
ncbi:putative cathepsin B6 cysteine protease [Monocercomonoides exilis]|uniref:putative cathepsin B6 cysteine protease n=1 Tax=Monocercomonoides exilis TaxID=2049356 RepID=UPI00355AB3B5|nr:putative cathepsin B6 cysteine protease [Monocercomonoides exilis]|eukprot:MONOS_5554.1-p1 / transcript=MONOS_5554.1 / gene=MONOS_5554 / organism=Monocercomonoides_exilis_PA203 / gene_product=cathepsin B6 cysteine protease / transcript_product=cathepsin B6 cysteine protease / location=Mono_scaffold00163:34183-35043(+) / protein_length=286 / sequence_SO=supercontig / SO=protein_coding / is_pseudo=false